MDYHKILGLAMPTNEPDVAFSYILSSLDNLSEIRDISTFLINFQDPWKSSEIEDAINLIKSKGFKVLWTVNHYHIEGKGRIPINRIRHDTSMLMPDALFFALTDDDFKYGGPSPNIHKSAGQQYLESLHYLLTHPNCGLVLMGSSMFRKVPKYHIGPVDINSPYQTGKGFIMRSMGSSGLQVPSDSLDLVGWAEEKLCAALRLSKGFYPAKMGFSRTAHIENQVTVSNLNSGSTRSKNKILSGQLVYDWGNPEIVDMNNHKYIREHYNPEFSGATGDFYVVTWKDYLKAGGLDTRDPDILKDYTIDYTEADSAKLLEEVKRRAEICELE